MMASPIHNESETPFHSGNKHHTSLFHSGVLLLEDAERAPEYLRITIDSDPDEPDQVGGNRSDSEEDVVVLGEKRPTYQEITLEEDEEGEVKEKVVEKEKKEPRPKPAEEALFDCTFCDKSFRVESLLKFHIKMHNSSTALVGSNKAESSSSTISTCGNVKIADDEPKKKRHSVDDQNNEKLKVDSKSPFKSKPHREKHRSHKHKKHKRPVSS